MNRRQVCQLCGADETVVCMGGARRCLDVGACSERQRPAEATIDQKLDSPRKLSNDDPRSDKAPPEAPHHCGDLKCLSCNEQAAHFEAKQRSEHDMTPPADFPCPSCAAQVIELSREILRLRSAKASSRLATSAERTIDDVNLAEEFRAVILGGHRGDPIVTHLADLIAIVRAEERVRCSETALPLCPICNARTPGPGRVHVLYGSDPQDVTCEERGQQQSNTAFAAHVRAETIEELARRFERPCAWQCLDHGGEEAERIAHAIREYGAPVDEKGTADGD